MTREKVLLVGDSNTSKSWSLLRMALLYPDNNIVLLDPDDGIAKAVEELGVTLDDLPNLTYVPVGSDFEEMMETYRMLREHVLRAGDWLCLDMLGRFWDLAQKRFADFVLGGSLTERLLILRRAVGQASFGGFDGMKDWPLIKDIYNDLVDDSVVYSAFNVMATTVALPLLPVDVKKMTNGVQSIYSSVFGVKPEGEKHNVYRFDTQAVLTRTVVVDRRENDVSERFSFRLARDRGREVDMDEEYDITGSSFWEVYAGMRGIKLGV